MPYIVRLKCEYCYVPAGSGGALAGQEQADNPSYSTTSLGGVVAASQTLSDLAMEFVPGGDSPSAANFQTALNAAAVDFYSNLTTAGSLPGFTSGTPLALIQAWPTGGP